MKAILISIKPEWVEKILNGEKTVEVRKTMPEIDGPFKVYIYCTKGKHLLREIDCCVVNKNKKFTKYEINDDKNCSNEIANGKVVAEFTCGKIEQIEAVSDVYDVSLDLLIKSCLKFQQLYNYSNGSSLYAWHITDLKIYDEPKELGDFGTYCFKCKNYNIHKCKMCDNVYSKEDQYGREYGLHQLTRPPQSWYYVEEL